MNHIKEIVEREANVKFNRNNKTCCMFHAEKTPSFSVDTKRGIWKCFGCGKGGDAIQFLREYKGIGYIEACKELDIEIDPKYKKQQDEEDKIKTYIEWQIKNIDDYKNFKLIDIYKFVDAENNIKYFKAKFKTESKKQLRYYSLDANGKVIPKRNSKELPYNLYSILEAIKTNKDVVIVEGEKDAETLNYLGYKATSLKGVTDFDYSAFTGAKVNIIGDTGEAGKHYIDEVYKNIYKYVKSFKIVKLAGLEALGDNKDISDWMQEGHTKEELRSCIYKALDLKNEHELQQDHNGIYKTIIKEKKDGIEKKIHYITNFNVISAKSICKVDEEAEQIEITLQTEDGKTFKKNGDVNSFNDVRSFKNFLGTMALSFKGKMEDLDNLKQWINRYFIAETEDVFKGIQFKDNMLITPKGAITTDGTNTKIYCEYNSNFNLNNELLTKGEATSLIKHLFSFNKEEYCCSILGTIVNNFAFEKAYKKGIKLHHLLIIGESGSGKSTTKESVINPILGYSAENAGFAIKNMTKYTLTNALSAGNYTKVFDEYKPSEMTPYMCDMINDMFKNAYDRAIAQRGNKNQTVRQYKLNSPIVLCGEEGFKNNDKASIERSLIVYLSKFQRPVESGQALKWLQDHEEILNKLGSTILNRVLNMSDEEYYSIRELYKESNLFHFKDRPLNTFINACTGFHILKDALEGIIGEEIETPNYIDRIGQVINQNVMQGGEGTTSIYENMLLQINDMIANEPYLRDDKTTNKIYIEGENTYIRINLVYDDLNKYIKNSGLSMPVLSKSDFITQCEKAGYIIRSNMCKKMKFDDAIRNVKTYQFDTDKLYDLGCEEIIGRGIVERKQKEHLQVVKEEQEEALF